MSNTPRMDYVAGHACGIVNADILAEGIKLERELNRACEMYRKLDIHTLNLVDRIKRLEQENDELRAEESRLLNTNGELERRIKQLEEENDAMRADLLLWSEQEVKP